MIPFFMDWGKISFTQIMFLQSWYLIWMFLLGIPSGTVADRFGRKFSLILSNAFFIIGVIFLIITPSFYMFLLGFFFWAVGATLYTSSYEAFVYDSLKKIKKEHKSKKIFGSINTFILLALAIVSPIGGIVAQYFGLRFTMLITILPFFLALIIALTFKEPISKHRFKTREYVRTMIGGVKYFYSNKILKMLAFDLISIAILVSALSWIYQLILKNLNVPLYYFGWIYALTLIPQIIIVNNFEKLEKIFGSKKRYLFLSSLIPGISFIILGFTSNILVMVIILLVIILGFGLSRKVLFPSYLNKYIETSNRSTVLSSIYMILNIISAVLFPILGFFVEKSVNYTLISIGILIIVFSILSRVKESHLID
jgi:MFS family permease